MSQCNVVEQGEVLMQLPHVPDMGRHRAAKLLRKNADREKLAHSRQSGAVGLDVVKCFGLQEILEHYPIGNVLPCCDSYRRNFARQDNVRPNVVRMRGLLDPQRTECAKLPRHANGHWKTPALISIEHESPGFTDAFPQHGSSA